LGGHGLVSTALADEDFSAANDEGRGDETKGWTIGPGCALWLRLRHTSSVNASKEMHGVDGIGGFGALKVGADNPTHSAKSAEWMGHRV